MKKEAFTLAEVLITIGVIGIVIAMTLPSLIENRKKTVIETRLKKFYTSINQAIMMSENVNGEKTTWTPKDTKEFWDIYLKNHIKYTKAEDWENAIGTRNKKIVFLPDGSAVIIDIYFAEDSTGVITNTTYGGHFIFCPEAKYCKKEVYEKVKYTQIGKNIFYFGFWPNETTEQFKYHKNKGVEAYKANWDGNPDSLYTHPLHGCNNNANRYFCTAVIERNGWTIPKNYIKISN